MPRTTALTALSIATLVLSAVPLAAQGSSADPTTLRRVDSVFAAYSSTATPGCAVGVDRGGQALLRRAYGMADLEAGTPWRVGTISESGSVAKQFTAAALVILAREGRLSLDDDVTKWVPEVRGFGKRITIRQLLSHTSGIPDRYFLHEMEGRPAGDVNHPNVEVLNIVSRLRDLNFDPGEDYLYSNTGYVIAVAVAERASGQSLQALTEERIFRPLGMQARWRTDHRAVVPGRAPAYSGTLASGFQHAHPFTRVYGAGGLLVTVDDFLKWTDALLGGDGGWGAVRDSLQAVIRLNDGTAITYGLGVTTDEWRGQLSRGVYRAPRTDDVMQLALRDSQLVDSLSGVVFLPVGNDRFRQRGSARTLTYSGTPGARRVRSEAPNTRAVEFERMLPPASGASATAAYAGAYRVPELSTEYKIEARGDSLFFALGWRGEQPLLPLYRDGFRTPGGERLHFTRDGRGRITGFVVWAGRVRHLRFERLAGGSLER